jgi:predicted RNA-binding protein YlxR (DUF448 family)
MSGEALIKEDITDKTILTDALQALQADGQWVDKTMASINQLYNQPHENRAHAIVAVVRFMAITEELHKKKQIGRPFWLIPEDKEMQVSRSKHLAAHMVL